MSFQEIIVYIVLAIVAIYVLYQLWKIVLLFKNKSKKGKLKGCAKDGCSGCN